MKASRNRRDFLKHCSQLGMGCSFLFCGKNIMTAKTSMAASQEEKKTNIFIGDFEEIYAEIALRMH